MVESLISGWQITHTRTKRGGFKRKVPCWIVNGVACLNGEFNRVSHEILKGGVDVLHDHSLEQFLCAGNLGVKIGLDLH